MQTLAADRIFRLLQVHITFRMTFVIFVVIVAYGVAIVLFQICMNSPVHRIKHNFHAMSSRGWLSHATRGWLSLCESMSDNPDCIFQCWSLFFQR